MNYPKTKKYHEKNHLTIIDYSIIGQYIRH